MSEEAKMTEMPIEEKTVKKFKKTSRRKVCNFCVDKLESIDYKDVNRLKKYITEKGKILSAYLL